MRTEFPGHYRLSQTELKSLWKESIVVVDTSVLLDIFRVSDDTAKQLLRTLEALKARLWLPYDVAREYHANLERVIAEQAKPYDEASKQLSELVSAFTASRKHPFIGATLLKRVEDLADDLRAELKTRKEGVLDLLTVNPLKDRIANLFDGRVGPPFSESALDTIYQEGKGRFAAEVPPGYADRKDKPEPRCYGDLVIWKAVLGYVASQRRACLMITADVKDDWFLRVSGRTIGPRPELIAEVFAAAKQRFHLYSADQFLRQAADYLGTDIPEDAIREVRDVAQARVERLLHPGYTKMALLRHLRRIFGADLPRIPMVRVGDFPNLWVARFPDGRRVLIESDSPERYALLSASPGKPEVLYISPELSQVVQPQDLIELPWLVPALNDLERRHRFHQNRRGPKLGPDEGEHGGSDSSRTGDLFVGDRDSA